MSLQTSTLAATGILLAAVLDRSIGDPASWLHPVVVMGWGIKQMRLKAENWAMDQPLKLSIAGYLITVTLVMGSGISGWLLEQLMLGELLPGQQFLGDSAGSHGWVNILASACWVLALASALAGKSLEDGVRRVLQALPAERNAEPIEARQRLSWIVGRDTTELSVDEILRATAETASENAVDGLFAPLFWMLVGLGLWSAGLTNAPGPLALAWSFKAASTLDSMLGYRQGRLRWLGTAGARLDDLLTWIPCRLVMLTLPLVSQPIDRWASLVLAAERDGQHDPSPNAGRSEAIYAHCAEVQLGGRNRYEAGWVDKPLLGNGFHGASKQSVETILNLSRRLEILWLLMALGFTLWLS